jgi:hypothetical protein
LALAALGLRGRGTPPLRLRIRQSRATKREPSLVATSARGPTRVLVLYDGDYYLDDEAVGAPGERTSVVSALELRSDVLDFLACANTECWR